VATKGEKVWKAIPKWNEIEISTFPEVRVVKGMPVGQEIA
jgi:hypothetical protein